MTIEKIQVSVVAILSAIFAFLQPIANDLATMLLLFAANAFFGAIADIVEGKDWDKRKFQRAFVEALLFFVFVFLIHAIGYFKHNMAGALQCVSFVSYALIYFYGTNICRNMKNILQEGSIGHNVFSFIYAILSTEFIKKVPYLQEYLKNEKK